MVLDAVTQRRAVRRRLRRRVHARDLPLGADVVDPAAVFAQSVAALSPRRLRSVPAALAPDPAVGGAARFRPMVAIVATDRESAHRSMRCSTGCTSEGRGNVLHTSRVETRARRRSLFGYNRAMVEQMIEEVAESFEAIWRERGELADSVEALEKQIDELRGARSSSLARSSPPRRRRPICATRPRAAECDHGRGSAGSAGDRPRSAAPSRAYSWSRAAGSRPCSARALVMVEEETAPANAAAHAVPMPVVPVAAPGLVPTPETVPSRGGSTRGRASANRGSPGPPRVRDGRTIPRRSTMPRRSTGTKQRRSDEADAAPPAPVASPGRPGAARSRTRSTPDGRSAGRRTRRGSSSQ